MRRNAVNDSNTARSAAAWLDAAALDLPAQTAAARAAYTRLVQAQPAEPATGMTEADALAHVVNDAWTIATTSDVNLSKIDYAPFDRAARATAKTERARLVRRRLYDYANSRLLDALEVDAEVLIDRAIAKFDSTVDAMFAAAQDFSARPTYDLSGSIAVDEHNDLQVFGQLVQQAEAQRTVVRELDTSRDPHYHHRKCGLLDYVRNRLVADVTHDSPRARYLGHAATEWGRPGTLEFWRALLARADRGDVWLARHAERDQLAQQLWPPKVMTSEQLAEARAGQAAVARVERRIRADAT